MIDFFTLRNTINIHIKKIASILTCYFFLCHL
jgi:hypothetical protein